MMNEPVRALLIFVNESDLWNDVPLYEAIVRRLRHLGMAGATAQQGLIGFGHHHVVHDQGLFGISENRPVTITVVDGESKVRAALPEIQSMVREGLIVLLQAELVADRFE